MKIFCINQWSDTDRIGTFFIDHTSVILIIRLKMDYTQWDREVALRMPITSGLDFDIERVIYEGRKLRLHGSENIRYKVQCCGARII